MITLIENDEMIINVSNSFTKNKDKNDISMSKYILEHTKEKFDLYRKLFNKEKLDKITFIIYDNREDWKKEYKKRFEKEPPTYSSGSFDPTDNTSFCYLDSCAKHNSFYYNQAICVNAHEAFHIYYKNYIYKEDRIVWFDEGMATFISGEMDQVLCNKKELKAFFERFYKSYYPIDNLNDRIQGNSKVSDEVIFQRDNVFNGYKASLLIINYLNETKGFEYLINLMKDNKKIRDVGKTSLYDMIKYYTKKYNIPLSIKKVKCIILDIDGTLTNKDKLISEYTKNTIDSIVKKEIMVILTSGRPVNYTMNMSKKCNASNIIISDNGSIIYDYKNDRVLFINKFNKKDIKTIWDICLKYNIDMIFNTKDFRYRKCINLDKLIDEDYDKIIDSIDEIKDDITQVVIQSKNKINLQKCIKEINDNGFSISNKSIGKREVYFADINCNNVTKGTAISKISDIYNFNNEEIMCIGDSINDIESFKHSGIKVAMKNAIKDLKNLADYTTEYTNDENGVAKFLKKYLEKK